MYRFYALLLDLLYLPLLLLILPLLYLKKAKYRESIPQRFAFPPCVSGTCLWIHGVSVGEIKAAQTFILLLRKHHPNLTLALSTTTTTGYHEAKRLFPDLLIFRFPFDLSLWWHIAFQRLHPVAVLLLELELWPNFLLMAQHKKIPVWILNGRLSPRSFSQYQRFRRISRWMFRSLSLACVQNEEYAQRFRDLGTPQVLVTGNMKMDQLIPPIATSSLREYFQLTPQNVVWVGGSTHPGENEDLIDSFEQILPDFPHLRLILVPRHPEKAPTIVEYLQKRKLPFSLWTENEGIQNAPFSNNDSKSESEKPLITVVARMGVLTDIYQISDFVFVGKSLKAKGGQNMLEPILLGKTVIVGPFTENFKEEMKFLREMDAIIEVLDEKELHEKVKTFLITEEWKTKGKASLERWKERMGASERNFRLLEQFSVLPPS